MDRAINDARLKSRIRVAHGYDRRHDTVAVECVLAVMSAANPQRDLILDLLACHNLVIALIHIYPVNFSIHVLTGLETDQADVGSLSPSNS